MYKSFQVLASHIPITGYSNVISLCICYAA